ncbi:hypothetical protein [Dyella jiangningensis]|uniref:Uncharacterized protein n=1 Tax=Dyella jiangningensis TaxID=1379159 RepID=A0A328P3B9_9GAMM|nr:hypothetical protein [Dyella jiangningensis]RAO75773.1 hypothetical protein CA260_17190 [Dyella jiangningensis]
MSTTSQPDRSFAITGSKALPVLLTLTSSALDSPIKTPDIRQNPTPKQRYEVTLNIYDAPGPFDAIHACANYRVTNEDCIPLTPVTGIRIEPQETLPMTLTKLRDRVYRGTVCADQLMDEDYYGLGICDWDLVAAGVKLTAGDQDFSPAIYAAEIRSGKGVDRYFSSQAYREYRGAHLVDIGNAHREDIKTLAPNIFPTTLTASEPAK